MTQSNLVNFVFSDEKERAMDARRNRSIHAERNAITMRLLQQLNNRGIAHRFTALQVCAISDDILAARQMERFWNSARRPVLEVWQGLVSHGHAAGYAKKLISHKLHMNTKGTAP